MLFEYGEPLAFYSGKVKIVGAYDYVEEGREHNRILAEGWDGCHFHQKTLLLRNEDYPENVTCHVRDPKVWKEQDTYCMVQGARRKDEVGEYGSAALGSEKQPCDRIAAGVYVGMPGLFCAGRRIGADLFSPGRSGRRLSVSEYLSEWLLCAAR